jgi:hypothetical protein
MTDPYRPSRIPDTKPRSVVRFRDGERIERTGVYPTPFGPERAKEIRQQARALTRCGPISDQLHEVMTDGEQVYVLAVWETIPGGASCWMTAFRAIEQDEVPR